MYIHSLDFTIYSQLKIDEKNYKICLRGDPRPTFRGKPQTPLNFCRKGGAKMAERTRKIQIKFFVTPEEKEYILQKQKSANISSLSAYLRKMAIDGKVICSDNF